MMQTNMNNFLCLHTNFSLTIIFGEDVSKCFFSLKEGLTLHFNMLEFPLQNFSLCQVLLKFGIREKVEIVKIKIKMYTVYRQTNRRTEAGQKVIRKVYLSFQLRWTKIKTPYQKKICMSLHFLRCKININLSTLQHKKSVLF